VLVRDGEQAGRQAASQPVPNDDIGGSFETMRPEDLSPQLESTRVEWLECSWAGPRQYRKEAKKQARTGRRRRRLGAAIGLARSK